jgi:hypothetical protein
MRAVASENHKAFDPESDGRWHDPADAADYDIGIADQREQLSNC